MHRDQITVVVLTSNRSSLLPALADELLQTCRGLDYSFRFLWVDDGSTDETPAVLSELRQRDERCEYLVLSRPVGHRTALAAGLAYATGDAVITTDGNRAHPFALIPVLLERWKAGYDIVHAALEPSHGTERLWRALSRPFQRVVDWMLRNPWEPSVADVGLVSRDALSVLITGNGTFTADVRRAARLREMRIGSACPGAATTRSSTVSAAEPNASRRGLRRATVRPLRLLVVLGWLVMLAGVLCGAGTAMCLGLGYPGHPMGMLLWAGVLLFGGLQFAATGAVLDYIARLVDQAQRLPAYFVREAVTSSPISGNRIVFSPLDARARGVAVDGRSSDLSATGD